VGSRAGDIRHRDGEEKPEVSCVYESSDNQLVDQAVDRMKDISSKKE
jgi:hypothetical protein